MGFGVRVCDLGTFRVVDVRPHPVHGVVAYLDMQFEVVGINLENHLSPIADRTEGIDLFVPNVGTEIESGELRRGEANAKILFDGSVSGVARAAMCLKLFVNAIEESLTGLDRAVLANLTHNFRDDLAESQAISGLLARGGRG